MNPYPYQTGDSSEIHPIGDGEAYCTNQTILNRNRELRRLSSTHSLLTFDRCWLFLGDEKISKTTISSNSQTLHLQFWIKSLIRQTYRARSHNHHTRGEDFINYVFEHSLLLDRVQYYLCASLKRFCLVRVLILYNLVPYVASEIVLVLHFNEDINVTENSDRLGINGNLLPPTKFHLNLTPVL